MQWLQGLRRLEAWTGPLVVDVLGRGRFEAQRADMLIGERRGPRCMAMRARILPGMQPLLSSSAARVGAVLA